MCKTKVALFLGAGFSKDAEFPIMRDFIYKVTPQPDKYAWEKAPSCLLDDESFKGLQAAWHLAHKSVPVMPAHNFESVFCLVDFHYEIKRDWKIAYYEGKKKIFADNGMPIKDVRQAFIRAIWQVFRQEPQWKNGTKDNYTTMFEKLGKTDLSIVTLNYDRLPLTLLKEIGREYYYSGINVKQATRSSGDARVVPIFKLHGSVNWFKDDENESITITEDQHNGFNPVITPPTWRKKALGKVWKEAISKMAQSDIIYVIGCGMAPTDLHVWYFLSAALGTAYGNSKTMKREVIVINPDHEAFNRMCVLVGNINRAKGNNVRIGAWYRCIEDAVKSNAFQCPFCRFCYPQAPACCASVKY